MLSAQAVESKDQKLTEDRQHTLKIVDKLSAKLQSIQVSFEKAWDSSKYPLENRINQACYIVTNNGAIGSKDNQIESLLAKFQEYQNADQIQANFYDLRCFWFNLCEKNKLNSNFRDSYLIILRIMEAYFLCAYMDNLENSMKPVPLNRPSIETEKKIDLESITVPLLEKYKIEFKRSIEEQSGALGNKILREIKEFNHKIEQYNQKSKAIADIKIFKMEKKVDSDSVRQLIAEEIAYIELEDTIETLTRLQHEISQSKQKLLIEKHNQIDDFLKIIRSQMLPIDCVGIKESQSTTELQNLQRSIDLAKRQNELRELESIAASRLQIIIKGDKKEFNHSIAQNVLAISKRPAVINLNKDKKAISKIAELCLTLLDELYKSPHVVKLQLNSAELVDVFPDLIDCGAWLEEQENIRIKLDLIEKNIQGLLKTKIINGDMDLYREKIINKEREVLYKLVGEEITFLPLIVPIHSYKLAHYRALLDANWDSLITANNAKDNAKEVKKITDRLADRSENAESASKKKIYKRAVALLNEKLSLFHLQSNNVILSNASFPEEKSPKYAGTNVELMPWTKKSIANDMPKIIYHSNLVKKPWKRTLLLGLVVGVGVGLIASGVGILFELSLMLILMASIGGGSVFGALAGVITYKCFSPTSDLPPLIVHRESVPETKNISMDTKKRAIMATVSAPSVMPVHAPNSLNDEESNCCCYGALFSRSKKTQSIDSSQLQSKKFKPT